MNYPEGDPSEFWKHQKRFWAENHGSFEQRLFHRIHTLERNLMADVSALNAAIEELSADEVAAVTEFQALSAQVAQLTTEQAPTQDEIDAITQKVTDVAAALKGGTPSEQSTPTTPETPVEPTPEASAQTGETPPEPQSPPAV